MRYTRNRQMRKLRKDWPWRVNVKIGTYYIPFVDKSFKWHREYNNVSFDTTHYYPKKITTPLYVDLYKEDSVYY